MRYSQILVIALAFSLASCQARVPQDPAAEALKAADEAIKAADEAVKAAEEAENADTDIALKSDRNSSAENVSSLAMTVNHWPTASDRTSYSWGDTALVFELPQEASFELLLADGDFPACGISAEQGGGLATFRRGSQVAEYGCWWSVQSETDGSTWIKLELKSGIQLQFPVRAFSKRPAL